MVANVAAALGVDAGAGQHQGQDERRRRFDGHRRLDCGSRRGARECASAERRPCESLSQRKDESSDSLPVPPGSCTSATRARRSSTGCLRGRRAARSCCASRTPTSSGPRASPSAPSSTICAGWGSTGTKGVEAGGDYGPYRQSERLHIYRAHAVELMARGQAYRCFCSAEQLEADRRGALETDGRRCTSGRCRDDSPPADARRVWRAASRRSSAFACRRARRWQFPDIVRGEVRFSDRRHRRSGARAIRRRSRLQLRGRRRRCADGDYACDSRRGSHLEHAAPAAAVRGVRLDAAGVCARLARARAGSCTVVEAAWRDVGEGVPRARVPAGGADELPRAAWLVAR